MQFDIILAVDSEFGIASSRYPGLNWSGTPAGIEDMKYFKQKTLNPGTAVIMGRHTWESIPVRPLKGRINIVISSSYTSTTIIGGLTDSPVVYVDSFNAALKWCAECEKVGAYGLDYCMVIGGLNVYNQALSSPWLRFGYITKFKRSFDCDLKIRPEIMLGEEISMRETQYAKYYVFDYTNTDEENYLGLLEELNDAPVRKNRTDVLTRGVFHRTLSFDLYDRVRGCTIMPLLTTKRVPWKSVYHENIWFLSGECTDTSYLRENKIPIWDGNSTREFLDKVGLTDYRSGEVGPIYGYQWRHWGAKYIPKNNIDKFNEAENLRAKIFGEEYKPSMQLVGGLDQIATVINKLKTDPWDRRMIVTAWNPSALSTQALPACHYSFQFHVDPDTDGAPKYLNCLVNMRSADSFLGVPFNVASYAFITHIVALIVGLTPGKLNLSMADCHIYENALKLAELQTTRDPRRFPTFKFSEKILNTEGLTIDHFVKDFTIDDYIIDGYEPHPFIKCEMVV